MSFEVNPGVGSGPTSISSGLGPLVDFTEHSAVDSVTGRNLMFIRVVQIREGDGRVAPPPPSILLASGQGAPTQLGTGGIPVSLESDGVIVANATLTIENDDIQLVEVEVLKAVARWHIQLKNNDSVSRRYAWVVGSTGSETRQPVLDVATTALDFNALTGETTPAKELTLANYGPGPLTVADLDGADLGSGFRLVSLAPRPIAGNGRAAGRVAFTAPPTAGPVAATHDFASDDPAATSVAGHSRRLALSATVRARALWDSGDVLVVIKQGERHDLHRLDRANSLLPLVVSDIGGSGIALDPANQELVSVDQGGIVRRIARTTGDRTVQTLDSTGGQLTGPTLRSDGTVFVYEDFESSPVSGPRNGRLWDVPRGGGAGSRSINHFGETNDRVGRIALEPSGDLLVLRGVRGLFRVAPSTATITRVQFNPGDDFTVTPLTRAADGSVVYVKKGFFGGGPGIVTVRKLERANLGTGEKTEICSLTDDVRDLAVAPEGVVAADASSVFAVSPTGVKTTLAQATDVVGVALVPVAVA